jgi:curved DNA-binding protein CbpA
MKEYYELLGLTETATDEEITARYNELKEKYKEERWQDGEAGNEASRMLTKIETAYTEILSARKEQAEKNAPMSYEEISAMIKEGKINEAQARLDDCNDRPAEWHYLQAVIFYKKNWTNESKKQLEIALQMEPDNMKYRTAYDKMKARDDFAGQPAGQTQNPYARNSYGGEPSGQMGGNACSDCCTCCYTYLCVDCLFSLCCGCR